jgi:RES domain-containing protein
VVYTSGSLSLALLETLVHLPAGVLPAFSAVPLDFDDSLVEVVEEKSLPRDWRSDPAPVSTQALGDAWVREGRSVALRVPSVVVPMESNYVLNPRHPDLTRVAIGTAMPFPFDSRLPVP